MNTVAKEKKDGFTYLPLGLAKQNRRVTYYKKYELQKDHRKQFHLGKEQKKISPHSIFSFKNIFN